MKSSHGFTVIELIVVTVILGAASLLFFAQKGQIESAARDDTRKISINAMYYSLEEVYYQANRSYPRSINSDTLPSVDPSLLVDTNGVAIGEFDSEYRYEPLNCDGDKCSSYELRATLESEDDYVKDSAN